MGGNKGENQVYLFINFTDALIFKAPYCDLLRFK